ncbi:YetF domain-containing protein [Paenalcaligenes niemegkensis]|uniref:YetF domain-containing protein n=1 Tax=Paenalcaligenes niemegkensis TaxID=2895469 RepID=UPI003567ABD3
MERVLSPPKRCIIKNGKLQRRIMREQFITLDELRSEMRLKDIEHLSEVENAYVEPSGELSFFRKEKQD